MAGNMTPDEENTITQLRNDMKKELSSAIFDTDFLYKFLKACNFNLTEAECMIRKSHRWRKEIQADTILTDMEPCEVMTKYMPQNLFGLDKEGCPVRYHPNGNTDIIGLLKSTNQRNFIRNTVRELEKDLLVFKSQSKKLGQSINQIVYIYDMKNLTLAEATNNKSNQLSRDLMKILQDNYPEHIKAAFVINASTYFMLGFPIVKTVLTNDLLNKFQIFGEDGWKEELLKLIDADVLPAFLGGNRTDPDGNPDCNTFINHGGVVPESYYLTKNPENLAQKEGAKRVQVDAQSSIQIPVLIEEPKSILHWEFETVYYDIGFGLTLDSSSQTTVDELIPVYITETENEPERGMYRCEMPGTYKLVFDNNYSWFTAKELYFRTWVTKADDDEDDALQKIISTLDTINLS